MQENVLRQVLSWESGSGATGHFGVDHSDWHRLNWYCTNKSNRNKGYYDDDFRQQPAEYGFNKPFEI